MAVGDVYRAIFRSTWRGNDVMLNILHYEVDVDPAGLASAGDLALSLDATFGDIYKALMTTEATYEHVTAQRIYPHPPTVPVTVSQETGAGEDIDGGASLPPQDAAVISKLTANAGRAYRGRVYLGGLGIERQDGARWNAVFVQMLNTYGAAMIQTRVTPNATYRPCLYALLPGQPPTVKGRVTPLTAFRVNPIVRTQRRRQVDRGD